jgi:chromosome segregation ATPase
VKAAPREAASLPDADKIKLADEDIARMKQVLKQVLSRLEDARSEKDVVKLNCVNEKLTQIKGLLRVSEQAVVSLQDSMARKDEGAEAESAKIAIARVKVDQLQNEAQECIGQLAFAVDDRTTVEVEQPKDLPGRDVTEREPLPAPVTRPPPISQFE